MKPSLDEKLKKIFEMMDTDGNGTVDAQEFTAFLKKEQNKATQALLVRSMRNDTKLMSLDEFRAFFADLIKRQDYTEQQLETTLGNIISSREAVAVAAQPANQEQSHDALDGIAEEQEENQHEENEQRCTNFNVHLSDAGSDSSYYLIHQIESPKF